MDTNEKVFNILNEFGLNWEVSKEPLVSTVDGARTNSYGIFKKTKRLHLSTVGDVYEPFQNHQLAEAMLIATENLDMPITNGGQLGEGRKIYLQAELPDTYVGRSAVKRYVTGLNSHDATASIGFGSSNTVVICRNTFFRAYKELTKVRHTMSADERVKDIAAQINAAILNDDKLIYIYKTMADTSVKRDMLDEVLSKIFALGDEGTDSKVGTVSSRKKNQIEGFAGAVRKEYKLEGETVWGLFNGITRYTNHVATEKMMTEEKRLNYIMVGKGYETSNMTFDILAKAIGISKEEMV